MRVALPSTAAQRRLCRTASGGPTSRGVVRRRTGLGARLAALASLVAGCTDPTGGKASDADAPLRLSVAPAAVRCTAGESVTVRATLDGGERGARVSFVVAHPGRAAVDAGGATATVRCAVRGRTTIAVTAARGGRRVATTVPVEVARRPATVVLFATPKMLADFAHPERGVADFMRHYQALTGPAAETIVIFGVGNSEHVLSYRGPRYWSDSVMWAAYTDGKDVPAFARKLRYRQIADIVRTFKAYGAATGMRLKVYDQIDPGPEMAWEYWKYTRHPECMDLRLESFDIRGRLKPDTLIYASAPGGAPAGKLCGEFIADQAAAYLRDLDFDGILYGNQFGTRGKWEEGRGPGYTQAEADAIHDFLAYSRRVYGPREIMWFDSYNNVRVERETFSFPSTGYRFFDYLMASGFCVITDTEKYVDNLESKLRLSGPRILATLDYVDPWYTYDSMRDFPAESMRLEAIALRNRDRIDGVVFFANDHHGAPVPRRRIEAFATQFYAE